MIQFIEQNKILHKRTSFGSLRKPRRIKSDENPVVYCETLVAKHFGKIPRKTGVFSYYDGHLHPVREKTKNILKPRYKETGEAAALMHDVAEMLRHPRYPIEFTVYDTYPKKECIDEKDRIVSISNLLSNAGEKGRQICYIIDRITHEKEEETYREYRHRNAVLSQQEPHRTYDTIEEVIKACDNNVNIDVLDLFLVPYRESSPNTFHDKLARNSRNYSRHYGPLLEKTLLIDTPAENSIFYPEKLKPMLQNTLLNSLMIEYLVENSDVILQINKELFDLGFSFNPDEIVPEKIKAFLTDKTVKLISEDRNFKENIKRIKNTEEQRFLFKTSGYTPLIVEMENIIYSK